MPLTIAETRVSGGGGYKQITPSYFATVGLTIVRGRGLTDADRKGSTPAIVVNQQFAEQILPGRQSDRIASAHPGDHSRRAGARSGDSLGDRRRRAERARRRARPITTTAGHVRVDRTGPGATDPASCCARRVDAAAITEPLRAAIRSIDPGQAVTNIRTISSMEDDYVAPDRLRTSLIAAFGAIALILAAVGIYGVMAYSVEQRTHEIGIRAALGAGSGALVGLVMRQAAVLAVVGVALGVGAALASGRVLSSLLFGVTPRDAVSITAAAVTLGVTALFAAWIPARRAAAVDPIRALKVE